MDNIYTSLNLERASCCLHGAFTHMLYSLWHGKVLCRLQKEKHDINSATKTLTYSLSSLQVMLGHCWCKTWVAIQCLAKLEAHARWGSPCPIIPGWLKSGDQIAQRHSTEANINLKKSMNWLLIFLSMFCYTHRLVPCWSSSESFSLAAVVWKWVSKLELSISPTHWSSGKLSEEMGGGGF